MAIETREGSRYLYVRFTYKKRRVYQSTEILAGLGKDEKRQMKLAEKVEARLRLEIDKIVQDCAQSGKPVQEVMDAAKPKKIPTLEELVARWWAQTGTKTYEGRDKTRYGYECDFVALCRVYPDTLPEAPATLFTLNRPVDQILTVDVLRYMDIRKNQGRSGRTISGERKRLMMMLRQAKIWGLLAAIPDSKDFPKIKIKTSKSNKRVLTDEHEQIYLAATKTAGVDLPDYAMLLMDTTAEPGPAAALAWPDISWEPAGKFRNGTIHDRCTKNDYRDRKLGMSTRLRAALHARWVKVGQPETGWVFPASRGDAHTPLETFRSAHERLWGNKSNKPRGAGKNQRHVPMKRDNPPLIDEGGQPRIPHFRLYDLRHTAGTRLGRVAELLGVRDAMGHANSAMTEHYLERDDRGRAAAFEALDKYLLDREKK